MASSRPSPRKPRPPGRKPSRKSRDYQADRDSGLISDYRPDPAPPSATGGGVIGAYGSPPKR